MREIFRPTACALSAVCLLFALSTISSGEVLAQAKQAPPKQSAPAQAAPPPAIENKANIDLVAKYYDKLAEALGESEE